jgi:pyruvate/2-oxoglutarate/acetoin dehydrogenase E1 component/TPP-dependent pyruvate/acetoin dehydrogenase alpha subunit
MLDITTNKTDLDKKPFPLSRETILNDFRICCISREVSLLARKEVLTGKAKFGITGDGKELPQVALAHFFKKGDVRSGYYRDQTLMFALGVASPADFFAQLYADPEQDPFSGGRQMNGHFATRMIDGEGNWLSQLDQYNVSSDVSCTGGQMARALGLALASKKYREIEELSDNKLFSDGGNEICFCTIGDASTSEGVFWETINAAGVMQVPLATFVWSDGYGISVPTEYQTVKGNIYEALLGMQARGEERGIDLYEINGWDYPGMVELFGQALEKMRITHRPALFHVKELTQPQGHSTSGSHERYKSKERLQWEKDFDGIAKMEEWMLQTGMFPKEVLDSIKQEAVKIAKEARNQAWKAYTLPTLQKKKELLQIMREIPGFDDIKKELQDIVNPNLAELLQQARRMYYAALGQDHAALPALQHWMKQVKDSGKKWYETHLYSESKYSALKVPAVPAVIRDDAPLKNGFEILNMFFDQVLQRDPRFFAFGEDVGQIGDVNQGFAGMQAKYGEERVFDTGIREWTIVGQAIGMAMRGLRPLAEIQYLDYLIYGLEPLVDDLATLRYRSNNIQQAPAIIRTRGHRLEGIWHSGSPMGMILNSIKGIYVLVPRNMTQAAGFYNTLLQSDDPAIVIECLNGYRLKERMPDNLGSFTVPLGVPEILKEGKDVTLVTYGSSVRIAKEGIKLLEKFGISVELIDVQSLIPFDLPHLIAGSLQKTNRVVFMDEDVPGGATAFMLQQVLEEQGAYVYLDSPPVTLTAKAHRPPYGSVGDYFSKPNPEDVFETIYTLMYEAEPHRFKGAL